MSTILDWKPVTPSERLWLVSNLEDGTHSIVDDAGKKGRPGTGAALQDPLGDVLAFYVKQLEGHAAFWVEFAVDRTANPLAPTANDKVHLVTPGFSAFTAFVEQKGGGFGGDRFDIELTSGVKFWSANVWSRGIVPVYLRKLLQPNALAIKGLRS